MPKRHAEQTFSLRQTALIVFIWSVFIAANTSAETATNLVLNGDFSILEKRQPKHWRSAGDPKIVSQRIQPARDDDGSPCVRMICTGCSSDSPAILAQSGMRLAKGKTYEFSCRLKGEGFAEDVVSVAIRDKHSANCGLRNQISIGGSWHTFRCAFHVEQDIPADNRLQFWFNEPGTLWVADVRIVELPTDKIAFTELTPTSSTANLIPNGSFELGESGWSSMGADVGWGNLPKLHGVIKNNDAPHGNCFLRIPVGGRHTPISSFDYFEAAVKRQIRPLAVNKGWIPVEIGAAYTMSCYLRSSAASAPAVIGAKSRSPSETPKDGQDYRQSVKLTTEWKRYEFTFRPRQPYVFIFVGPDLKEEQTIDVDVDGVQLEKSDHSTAFTPANDVEFSVEPAVWGGVIDPTENRSLIVNVANHGKSLKNVTVRLTAADFFDVAFPLPNQQFAVAALSNQRRRAPLPDGWRGFYRVSASADGALSPHPAEIRLALVPRRSDKESFFAVNHAFSSPELMRLVARCGVSSYRDWSLKWQHIEPVKGRFNWETPDAQIDRVVREGASVLTILPPFPSTDWCSEAPPNIGSSDYPGVRLRQGWAPKNPADLAAFIARAMSRYKNRIHYWEFLNEPLYTDYSLSQKTSAIEGGKRYEPTDYASLLDLAAKTMRKTDPNCKIIGGIGGGPLRLTKEVIDAGILKHIDMLNLHIYPGLRTPESYTAEFSTLLKMMDAQGKRVPIWITEFAYYAMDNRPRYPFYTGDQHWIEACLLENERECADFTVRFFAIALARGVEKIFVHAGSNAKPHTPELECPLLDHGSPRKVLPALAVLTEMLGPAPSCVGERNLKSGPICCVAFETPKRSVLVVWSASGKVKCPTALAEPSRYWFDIMGRKIDQPPVMLSGSPIYLVTRSGCAKDVIKAINGE